MGATACLRPLLEAGQLGSSPRPLRCWRAVPLPRASRTGRSFGQGASGSNPVTGAVFGIQAGARCRCCLTPLNPFVLQLCLPFQFALVHTPSAWPRHRPALANSPPDSSPAPIFNSWRSASTLAGHHGAGPQRQRSSPALSKPTPWRWSTRAGRQIAGTSPAATSHPFDGSASARGDRLLKPAALRW